MDCKELPITKKAYRKSVSFGILYLVRIEGLYSTLRTITTLLKLYILKRGKKGAVVILFY